MIITLTKARQVALALFAAGIVLILAAEGASTHKDPVHRHEAPRTQVPSEDAGAPICESIEFEISWGRDRYGVERPPTEHQRDFIYSDGECVPVFNWRLDGSRCTGADRWVTEAKPETIPDGTWLFWVENRQWRRWLVLAEVQHFWDFRSCSTAKTVLRQ